MEIRQFHFKMGAGALHFTQKMNQAGSFFTTMLGWGASGDQKGLGFSVRR
jgi:hypothetical protein